jgi:hypothetical protein
MIDDERGLLQLLVREEPRGLHFMGGFFQFISHFIEKALQAVHLAHKACGDLPHDVLLDALFWLMVDQVHCRLVITGDLPTSQDGVESHIS